MKVEFTKSSEKELLKLQKPFAQKIYKKVMLLAEDKQLVRSEKLEGGMGYRISVGDYRVVYIIEKKTLVVIRIRHRREVYKP